MRIGIVNDLNLALEILSRAVSGGGHEVAWTARDGAEAVDKCAEDKPDLVLMDLIMPVMDGAEATKRIMEKAPCPILVVTASVGKNSEKTFEAMGYGALDAVKTPSFGEGAKIEGGAELLAKIDTIANIVSYAENYHRQKAEKPKNELPPLVAIGCSTGGPGTLADILSQLPGDMEASIVIAQHVDARFAEGLSEWLDLRSALPVILARENEKPESGKVYLACTKEHLTVSPKGEFRYSVQPSEYHYTPSINELFSSLARNWREKGLAALLTGMGNDGANGLLLLRKAGWTTVAQDKESSVVYGMPKAAAEIGAARKILPASEIPGLIVKFSENPVFFTL